MALLLAAAILLLPVRGRADTRWQSLGPEGGMVFVLAVDPVDSGRVYAGTADGLFRSTDGGATWRPADRPPPGVGALVADPRAAGTVYASTFYNGVWKSTDAGATWSATSVALPLLNSVSLVIDAASSALYAGPPHVIYRCPAVVARIRDALGLTRAVLRDSSCAPTAAHRSSVKGPV